MEGLKDGWLEMEGWKDSNGRMEGWRDEGKGCEIQSTDAEGWASPPWIPVHLSLQAGKESLMTKQSGSTTQGV